MIIPDVNLLVYAYNSDAPAHAKARAWWEHCLSGQATVGLAWAVLLGYVRIMTSRQVLKSPFEPLETLAHVRAWLERPQAAILVPGPRHLDVLEGMMAGGMIAGRLTTDAHLAALAIENQADLHSNDTDFSRFPGLRWVNPLD